MLSWVEVDLFSHGKDLLHATDTATPTGARAWLGRSYPSAEGVVGKVQLAALRQWASGSLAREAAVDLLLEAFNGRFAAPGQPWLRRAGERLWLDVEVLAGQLPGPWSSGEQRILQVAASLAGGPPVDLGDVLCLDQGAARLVLTDLTHVAGVRRLGETYRAC